MAEYKAPTNEIKQVELESRLQQVAWTRTSAAPGADVDLAIITSCVGNGAEVRIELSDHSGKGHGKLKEMIVGNRHQVHIRVPEKARDALYADVKLPKHGLKTRSPALLLIPPIEIKNLKWSAEEARRGDVLTLTADVEGAPAGVEAAISIWEHDVDGANDLIARLSTPIERGRIEVEWEYEFVEDTDDIPTEQETKRGYRPPEYFFRVDVGGVTAQSELLPFDDVIEIELTDAFGNPIPNESYILHGPDDEERKGTLDDKGKSREEDIPPGPYRVEFPDLD